MRSTLRCCKAIKRCALGSEFPWCERRRGSIPCSTGSSTWLLAQAAEDGERIGGLDLVDELTAGLDLTVQARGQGVGVLAARCADDEVVEPLLGLVALGLEPRRELACLLTRGALHAHLPRRESAPELFLFPRLAGWLVAPAVLLVDPVLDATRPRLDAVRP